MIQFVFVKIDTTEFIISVLNILDKNIQFTFEEENDEAIPFLDILISRKKISQQQYIENRPVLINI